MCQNEEEEEIEKKKYIKISQENFSNESNCNGKSTAIVCGYLFAAPGLQHRTLCVTK